MPRVHLTADNEILSNRRRSAAVLTAMLVAAMAHATAAVAQEDGSVAVPDTVDSHIALRPVVQTARLEGGLSIDGLLEESAWTAVDPTTAFTQTEPDEGAPATERTEVRVLYDEAALYIGARMFESSGDVRRRLGRRDSNLSDSDWLYVMLDSHHTHVNAFQFSVNPAGVKRDEIVGSGQRPGQDSWDAVWDVATSVDDAGWTAEVRIPFSQLRFGRDSLQTWGIQLSRRAISKEEVTVLAFTPKSERGGVARYAHLVGLEGIRPGKRIEVMPYIATRAEYTDVAEANPYRDGADQYSSAGLDLKYRVTSTLTLDATVNPDFGQVELDPAVVNLTAFETSLDEKRPFFVEGQDIFRIGEARMFYSRRIGRAPQVGMPAEATYADRPEAATILGAAKLSGRTTSGWSVGALAALTEKESAPFVDDDGLEGDAVVEPLTGYFAGRVERLMRDGQSAAGGILTATVRDLDDDALSAALRSSAFTGGLDFSHEFLDRAWSVSGYIAASHVRGSPEAIVRTQRSSSRYFQRPDADYIDVDSSRTSLHGYAGRLTLRKSAGLHWRGDANVSAVSPGFEINDIGFQTGVDRIGADVNITWVENRLGATFRNYRISLRNSRDWNHGWDPVGGRSTLSFNGQLLSYWGGNVNLTRSHAVLDDRLTRGGPLARNLADWNADINVNSDSRRTVSARFNSGYSWGESGSWNSRLSLNLTFRPAENWTISVGPSYRRSYSPSQYVTSVSDETAVETYGRRYIFAPIHQTTVEMDTRLNVNFTPTLSLDLFAQPFVSSGDYGDPQQLRAPRTYEFDPYAPGIDDRDFNRRSLRGNAVMRWEWRPGSTLYLVWQQRRSGSLECGTGAVCERGHFELARDARAIFDLPPENVFQLKINYWLNL